MLKKKARIKIRMQSYRFGLSGARQNFCPSAKDPENHLSFSYIFNLQQEEVTYNLYILILLMDVIYILIITFPLQFKEDNMKS